MKKSMRTPGGMLIVPAVVKGIVIYIYKYIYIFGINCCPCCNILSNSKK